MMAFLSKGGEGGQITCMTGAVVKQNKSGQEYCDCSAVMSRDILAGKLVSKQSNILDFFSWKHLNCSCTGCPIKQKCERQATQFCLYGGTGASSPAFCTNGGTCKSINYNQNQV